MEDATTVVSSLPASTPDEPAAAHPPGWPAWQRVLFRYALCHYLLYSFPRPLTELLNTIVAGVRELPVDATARPWRWPGKWSMELGKIENGWQQVTTWLHEHHLAPYEVIHQRTGSGDTGHDFARLCAIVAASVLLTTIWSMVDRRTIGYPRLGRWLHLVVRFDLAFWQIGYGLAKFYGGQFGELELMRATQEIGDTTQMGMVGSFMQAFPGYELFGGGGEVLGGLLLFHHRTALLGACVSIAVMTNVCAINWLCGVPVKLFSSHLLLFAIGLLAPFAPRLWALFVSNRTSAPVDIRVVRSPWLRWPLLVFGFAWVLGSLTASHFGYGEFRSTMRKGREKSALYGLWTVEKMLVDGQELAPQDTTRWRFVAIDRGTLLWTRTAAGERRFFDFAWDPQTNVAQVKERRAAGGDAGQPWTSELGKKVVPAAVPLLLRPEDYGRRVDAERRTLVLKGHLGEKQYELHTIEKELRVRPGFRLRQELPEGW